MSEQVRQRPGFHAIMMAAAFAEEGLADTALEVLRESVGEHQRKPTATPVRRWTGLGAGAGPGTPRTA
jgi:hypothetical protein